MPDAVVEPAAVDDVTIKCLTVPSWYPGDGEGDGGIYNVATKRGRAAGP